MALFVIKRTKEKQIAWIPFDKQKKDKLKSEEEEKPRFCEKGTHKCAHAHAQWIECVEEKGREEEKEKKTHPKEENNAE